MLLQTNDPCSQVHLHFTISFFLFLFNRKNTNFLSAILCICDWELSFFWNLSSNLQSSLFFVIYFSPIFRSLYENQRKTVSYKKAACKMLLKLMPILSHLFFPSKNGERLRKGKRTNQLSLKYGKHAPCMLLTYQINLFIEAFFISSSSVSKATKVLLRISLSHILKCQTLVTFRLNKNIIYPINIRISEGEIFHKSLTK